MKISIIGYKNHALRLKDVLNNMPSDWLNLTTHRLDIYNEKLAKVEFLEKFQQLFESNICDENS